MKLFGRQKCLCENNIKINAKKYGVQMWMLLYPDNFPSTISSQI
jgi:hypothetical protein